MSDQINAQQFAAMIPGMTLGVMLLAHGLLKLMVFGITGTVGYFESLGLPAITAYLTIAAEIAAGLGLIMGVYSRLAATLSVPLLLGASWAMAGYSVIQGWLGVPSVAGCTRNQCRHPATQSIFAQSNARINANEHIKRFILEGES